MKYLPVSPRKFPEMVEHIRQVAVKAEELTVEERHILSVAYKNLITPLRNSWRTLSSLEHRTKSDNTKISLMGTFRQKLEGELSTICNDILGILETNIVPSATSAEARVFYHKMYVYPSFLQLTSLTYT
jgi:14-3-3 protein epsilon